jgi:hypothetical protein
VVQPKEGALAMEREHLDIRDVALELSRGNEREAIDLLRAAIDTLTLLGAPWRFGDPLPPAKKGKKISVEITE